jgi:hypothetical protein
MKSVSFAMLGLVLLGLAGYVASMSSVPQTSIGTPTSVGSDFEQAGVRLVRPPAPQPVLSGFTPLPPPA